MTLWHGRFGEGPAEELLAYTVSLPFDVRRDFTPVSLVVLSSGMLVVRPDLPVRSVAELVAYARANPGRLNCGNGGAGSSQHLTAAMFEHLADVQPGPLLLEPR